MRLVSCLGVDLIDRSRLGVWITYVLVASRYSSSFEANDIRNASSAAAAGN